MFTDEDEGPDDSDDTDDLDLHSIATRMTYASSSYSARDDNLELGEVEAEEKTLQLEYEIVREQKTATNAYYNLGVIYGADALILFL